MLPLKTMFNGPDGYAGGGPEVLAVSGCHERLAPIHNTIRNAIPVKCDICRVESLLESLEALLPV